MAPASAFVKGLRPQALAADSIWVSQAFPARVQRRRAGRWRCAPWRRRDVDAPVAGDERGAWRLAKGVCRHGAPPRHDICGGPLLCPPPSAVAPSSRSTARLDRNRSAPSACAAAAGAASARPVPGEQSCSAWAPRCAVSG